MTKHISLDELPNFAQEIAEQINSGGIVTLSGDLGAGKTTLTNAIAKHLGIENHLPSPTFTIMNVYSMPSRKLLYHFDLYRLKDFSELLGLGIEEVLADSNNIIMIEWPELVLPFLPESTQHIKLEIVDEFTRKVTIN